MVTTKVKKVLLLLLVITILGGVSTEVGGVSAEVEMVSSKLTTFTIKPNGRLIIQSNYSLYSSGRFYVPQCFSNQYNFTLGPMTSSHASTHEIPDTGVALGYDVLDPYTSNLLIWNPHNSSIELSCFIANYGHNEPVPGGCNIEFNFEHDPNLRIWYDGFQFWILFQYAMIADDEECSIKNNWYRLKYALYVYDFQKGYDQSDGSLWLALAKLKSVSDIKSHSTMVSEFTRVNKGRPIISLMSYAYHAVIVSLVVTDTQTGGSAAYVSTVSYGCDINDTGSSKSCLVKWYFYLITYAIAVQGLVVLFAGHRLIHLEMFYSAFLFALAVSIVIFLATGASKNVVVAIICCVLISIAIGLLFTFLWHKFRKPLLSLIIPTICCGFILAAVIFYTPLANSPLLKNSWVLWLFYLLVVVFMVLFMVVRPKIMNIIICAFIGSYSVVATISLSVNASLHHIVIQPFREITVSKYYTAWFHAPFTPADIGLTVTWVLLGILGAALQFYREKGRPNFPVVRERPKSTININNPDETTGLLARDNNEHYSDLRGRYGGTSQQDETDEPSTN